MCIESAADKVGDLCTQPRLEIEGAHSLTGMEADC